MLAKLAKEAFESSGWPTRVQTGRMCFPLDVDQSNIADMG